MQLKELLGQNIKKLRKIKKMTQAYLAEMVDVEPKHISCIENGLAFPSALLIEKFAAVLGVEPYELFLGKEKPQSRELKDEIIKIINNASESEIEQIYLFAAFIHGRS